MPFTEHIETLVADFVEQNSGFKSVKESCDVDQLNKLAQEVDRYRGRPLFYKYVGSGRGQGPYVELVDGSVKMDLINGIGIHILGHAHPNLIRASLRAALSDVVMQGNLQPNKEYLALTKKLVELGSKNSRLNHAWLCQSGSMANENGLKICRQKMNGARIVIAFKNAFAGRTTMMAEVTDNDNYRMGLPRYEDVVHIPYYDAENPNSIEESKKAFFEVVEKHKGNICCFMFEPMQGEGGYRVAPREFFLPLLEKCKEERIPVFLDEVQTFCRTGNFFAYETLGLGDYVDVVSVAKTLQNGATLYTNDFNPKPGLISGTFSGSTQSLAAGLSVLETLEKDFVGEGRKIDQVHKMFVEMLRDLAEGPCKGLVSEVEGMGLMVAFTPFSGKKDEMLSFIKKLFDNGLMAFGCGSDPYRVRFLLPAILEKEDISEIKNIMEKTLLELK